MLVSISIDTKFVTVATDVMAAWKLASMVWLSANRDWKYGAAAKNMFLYISARER